MAEIAIWLLIAVNGHPKYESFAPTVVREFKNQTECDKLKREFETISASSVKYKCVKL